MRACLCLLVLCALGPGCGLSLDLDPPPPDGGGRRDAAARMDGDVDRCRTNEDCRDTSPCTRGVCDTSTGVCQQEPQAGESCDDGDACTDGDACDAEGVCTGEALCPDDGNPCTREICDGAGGCDRSPRDGMPCDDGIACTGEGTCAGTSCGVGEDICPAPPGSMCISGNYCDHDTGVCELEIVTSSCDDANPCTVSDACTADGRCVGVDPCPASPSECSAYMCHGDASAPAGYRCEIDVLTGTPCGPGGVDTCADGACGCPLGQNDCDGLPGCECMGVCGSGGGCMPYRDCIRSGCPSGLICCATIDRCITTEQRLLCPAVS